MTKRLIKHEGELDLGNEDLKISCYVLADGTRVLSGRGMQNALKIGQTGDQKEERKSGVELARFFKTKWLKSLVSNEKQLERFQPLNCYKGKQKINGYEATVLVDLCDLILAARKDESVKFNAKQSMIAAQAEVLVRSFAKVGIIALVDEATGYQYEREALELQKILKAYINEELLPWQQRFPHSFYKEIFRLNGWNYTPSNIKSRPGVIGIWTNNLIYKKLPRGVLDELKTRTPKNAKGKRKHKFHQLLTEDIGHPQLQQQLTSVITIMRLSRDWKDFEEKFNQLYGQTMLDFPEDEPKQLTGTPLDRISGDLKRIARVPKPEDEEQS